jgi:hypothetical protein
MDNKKVENHYNTVNKGRTMIIQVRGTSGSGKSTVMRRVMERLGNWKPHYTEWRKKPLWYNLVEEGGPKVVVLGHYETLCGGCDTIGSARQVYEVIQLLPQETVVLCEGLLLSEDVKWSSQLKGLRIVYLTTPLEDCLKNIEKRRKLVGNHKPVNPANTTNRVRIIDKSRFRLREMGISCVQVTVEQAVSLLVQWVQEPSLSTSLAGS